MRFEGARKNRRMRSFWGLVFLLAAVGAATSADAKPKILNDGSGCTAAQIQKWGNFGAGKACLDANESGNLPVAQTLYCSSDGSILCCQGAGDDRQQCTVIGHENANPIPKAPFGKFSNSPNAH